MSLRTYLRNAPSLIISIGVLFGLNSIYNEPLPFNFELFKRLKASS